MKEELTVQKCSVLETKMMKSDTQFNHQYFHSIADHHLLYENQCIFVVAPDEYSTESRKSLKARIV